MAYMFVKTFYIYEGHEIRIYQEPARRQQVEV